MKKFLAMLMILCLLPMTSLAAIVPVIPDLEAFSNDTAMLMDKAESEDTVFLLFSYPSETIEPLIEQYIQVLRQYKLDYSYKVTYPSHGEEENWYVFNYTGSLEFKGFDVQEYQYLSMNDCALILTYAQMSDDGGYQIMLGYSPSIEYKDTGYRYQAGSDVPMEPGKVKTAEPASSNEKSVSTASHSTPTLPDPGAFLGGMKPHEDQKADYIGEYISFKSDYDAGYKAAKEYLKLLQDTRFNLTMRNQMSWNLSYLKEEMYFFDYTGNEQLEPAKSRYYEDGFVDFSCAVCLSIQRDGESGTTLMSLTYSSDFDFSDMGDRASNAPKYTPDSPINSDTDSPDWRKDVLDCLTCRGTKVCTECNGYGQVRYNGAKATCPKCRGGRKCTSCGGTGKR